MVCRSLMQFFDEILSIFHAGYRSYLQPLKGTQVSTCSAATLHCQDNVNTLTLWRDKLYLLLEASFYLFDQGNPIISGVAPATILKTYPQLQIFMVLQCHRAFLPLFVSLAC